LYSKPSQYNQRLHQKQLQQQQLLKCNHNNNQLKGLLAYPSLEALLVKLLLPLALLYVEDALALNLNNNSLVALHHLPKLDLDQQQQDQQLLQLQQQCQMGVMYNGTRLLRLQQRPMVLQRPLLLSSTSNTINTQAYL
jgi:hypothetical protein